ncbi:MAG: cell division protein FtsL [Rhizomicrobium sp.]
MVRILNFLFVALAGLSCFAMNHIAEKTRLAGIELKQVHRQIAAETDTTKILQAQWQTVAEPRRIQQLAQEHLGLTDTPTLELSSLELLPRRGEALDDNPVRAASLVTQAPPQATALHLTAVHSGN